MYVSISRKVVKNEIYRIMAFDTFKELSEGDVAMGNLF